LCASFFLAAQVATATAAYTYSFTQIVNDDADSDRGLIGETQFSMEVSDAGRRPSALSFQESWP